MRVYSPTEWGAQVNYDLWSDPFTPDDGVALHHGGSSNYAAAQAPYTFEKETALLRSWERYHLRKGWRGLAYGFGVAQSGRIYRIRGFNRYGAHLGDIDGDGIANNDEIIPIIWLASGNHHEVTPAADQAISWLRKDVLQVRSPDAIMLYGHKEIQLDKPTACPGPGGMRYVTTHRIQKGDTVFTDHEVEQLKLLVASLDEVDSNGGFAKFAVKLIRRERDLPLHAPQAGGLEPGTTFTAEIV